MVSKKTKAKSNEERMNEILNNYKSKRPLFTIILIIASLFILATGLSGCTSLIQGEQDTGNVALIQLVGGITTNDASHYSGSVSASRVVEWIDDANEDDSIKAIVVEINSGGGSPVGSADIARALKESKKPTIAVIRDIGASGAYWVASASDHIIANELSLVGSIGVIGSYLEFEGFLEEHNITYRREVAGKYKDMGSPFKEMTPDEEIKNQKLLNKMHEVFIKAVSKNRNMSYGSIKQLATGELFLGSDAINNGLIDEIGGFPEAESYLESKFKLKNVDFKKYSESRSFISELTGFSSKIGSSIGESIVNSVKETQSKSSSFRT
jgi:protease-4